MEILLVIGFIVFLVWAANRDGNKTANTGGNNSWSGHAEAPRDFEVKAATRSVDLDGTDVLVLEAHVRGRISGPRPSFPYQLVLHIFDVTEGEEKPVFCALDNLQEALTLAVEARSSIQRLPYEHSVLSNWTRALGVPRDMLSLPRSGSRLLKFRVQVVAAEPRAEYVLGTQVLGTVLESASVNYRVQWTETGYEQLAERRARAEELTLKLAMAVSASDGHMAPEEGAVIREWLAKRIDGISDEDRKAEEKRRLNGLVRDAYEAARAENIDVRGICSELREITDTAHRYDILELCFHVAAADGAAEKAELDQIRSLGDALGVSLDRLRTMEQKILPVSIHAGDADDEGLLGIRSTMSRDEIRKHLNREYRKWNSLTSHSDRAKREQAEEMLRRIATARRKYVA